MIITMKDISEQLRELRHKANMSLYQVARKADTSPATLFRYENGWKRFEVYTLDKVASALGYRVRISFERLPETTDKPLSLQSAVKRLRRLFWDSPLKAESFRKYPGWVVERVLDYGTLKDVQGLVQLLGRDRFLGIVSGIRFKSARTAAFWQNILRKENVKCIQKSFPREAGRSLPG
jgi:transcriptional regulator with XRE-family HTH domain